MHYWKVSGLQHRAAYVDTVGCLTMECFETHSVRFLSPPLPYMICKLMFLFLFLGKQASRGALAFILITQEYMLFFPSNDPHPPHLQDWQPGSL